MSTPQKNALEILNAARLQASDQETPYAGSVTPKQAWQLFNSGEATLVDIRSNEELHFVGRVPGSAHIAWATGTSLTRNPRFAREIANKFDKNDVLLLLCRSGKRSALAAEVLTNAGFSNVFNVLEGFEGEINEHKQRGFTGGWQFHQLPWEQD
ncbi:MAG: rhodanese-like domain-containing protein [Burkholderiales bacterium]|jgi:rhodanese-related sulfurtransferase|nr:rhodanese-like domain-containing protein [Burkholderiales bacterium]